MIYIRKHLIRVVVLTLISLDISSLLFSGSKATAIDETRLGQTSALPAQDKSIAIYKRLVGTVPLPEDPVFQQISQLVSSGDLYGAAQLATKQDNFFKITLFYMVAKMSNRAEVYNVLFNDFIATFIGCAREGLVSGNECNAKTLLSGNYRYIRDLDAALTNGGLADYSDPLYTAVYTRDDPQYLSRRIWAEHSPDYSPGNMPDMYIDFQRYNFNLNHLKLESPMRAISYYTTGCNTPDQPGSDCAVDKPVPDHDASPLLASRQFGQEHFNGGTARRPVEYTFREFLCIPVIGWSDVTNPDDRVGSDVTRMPSGSNQLYQTTCRGCHSGVDHLRGAFARHDWGKAVVTLGLMGPNGDAVEGSPNYGSYVNVFAIDDNYPNVARKMNRNALPENATYHPVDDSWSNVSTNTANAAYFGWNGPMSGNGLNSFATMVANSDRFPKCMAQRAFREVCKRDAVTSDIPMLDWAASEFKNDNYNLRNLFARVAIQKECLGE